VLPPAVDRTGLTSAWRLRRRQNQIPAANRRKSMIATGTKVPATFPESEKKPPPLLSFAATETVVVAAGGAVGVMVKVCT